MTNDSFYLGIQKERGLDGEFPFWCSVTPLLHRTQKGRFFAERSGRAERLLCTFCYGVNNFVHKRDGSFCVLFAKKLRKNLRNSGFFCIFATVIEITIIEKK